jgi:pimeloyl-ACP methyl ester carboxylesterase
MPTVTMADENLFYVVRTAAKSDDVVLFIHGAGGTHKHWAYQLQALEGARRYALDLPAHGRSGGKGRRAIEDYAEVILGLLDSLELGQVTLVGHSMGGAISQHLALEFPSRVQRLVLVGSGARLRVLPDLLDGVLDDFESTAERMMSWAYSGESDPQLVDLARAEWLENEPVVVHGDFSACDRFDVMVRLAEIRCPTLVICGEDDRLTPTKYARHLRDNIPDAELTIVPHAGHMVMMEQPEAVNRALEEFLARTAS